MSNSRRLLSIAVGAAAVTNAVWAAQVQAAGKEIGFPRQQIAADSGYGRQPQDAAKSDDADAAIMPTSCSNGRISFAQDGQLVGPPKYASRQRVGSAEIVTFVATPPPRTSAEPGDSPTGLPVAGRLSSSFGYRLHPILGGMRWHGGIDIAAPLGTPIQATSDGRVERASWDGGYGLMVELDDGGGTETLYGHMSRVAVEKGQVVKKGEVLGYVGSTGLSTGPHVHYEIRRNGRSIDPAGTGALNRRSSKGPVALP